MVMTSVDWLRLFKNKMILKISSKTGWGKNDLIQEIDQVYMELMEEMINPEEKK